MRVDVSGRRCGYAVFVCMSMCVSVCVCVCVYLCVSVCVCEKEGGAMFAYVRVCIYTIHIFISIVLSICAYLPAQKCDLLTVADQLRVRPMELTVLCQYGCVASVGVCVWVRQYVCQYVSVCVSVCVSVRLSECPCQYGCVCQLEPGH
jgi:hypothetical protein